MAIFKLIASTLLIKYIFIPMVMPCSRHHSNPERTRKYRLWEIESMIPEMTYKNYLVNKPHHLNKHHLYLRKMMLWQTFQNHSLFSHFCISSIFQCFLLVVFALNIQFACKIVETSKNINYRYFLSGRHLIGNLYFRQSFVSRNSLPATARYF